MLQPSKNELDALEALPEGRYRITHKQINEVLEVDIVWKLRWRCKWVKEVNGYYIDPLRHELWTRYIWERLHDTTTG